MSTHNLCLRAKYENMYTPVHPSFTIQKWGVRGYSIHGLVFVMTYDQFRALRIYSMTSKDQSPLRISNLDRKGLNQCRQCMAIMVVYRKFQCCSSSPKFLRALIFCTKCVQLQSL